MTLRAANALARETFGPGAYCESARGRRTLSFKRGRTRFTLNWPPKTPWEQVFGYTATLAAPKPEGTT